MLERGHITLLTRSGVYNSENCNISASEDCVTSGDVCGFEAYSVKLSQRCRWKAVLAKNGNDELGYYFKYVSPLETHCKGCFSGSFRMSNKLIKMAAALPLAKDRTEFNKKIQDVLGYCVNNKTVTSHNSRKRRLANSSKKESNTTKPKKKRRNSVKLSSSSSSFSTQSEEEEEEEGKGKEANDSNDEKK